MKKKNKVKAGAVLDSIDEVTALMVSFGYLLDKEGPLKNAPSYIKDKAQDILTEMKSLVHTLIDLVGEPKKEEQN